MTDGLFGLGVLVLLGMLCVLFPPFVLLVALLVAISVVGFLIAAFTTPRDHNKR